MEQTVGTVPEVILNSGHKMPGLGFGTAAHPMPPPDQLKTVLLEAISAGYRHFDTAAMYGSEEAVGRAVATAIERGLVKDRSEIFITSKLFITDTHRDLVAPALEETLRKLGQDYIDLYLIHWPIRTKQTANAYKLSEEDMLYFDIEEVWEAMERCSRLGLAKSIGVSNFSCEKLSKLLRKATIPPAVNQVEMNVAWQQRKMLEFCKEKRIHVCAWSPLGANGALWGSYAVMENPILEEIAAAKNKTKAQVALRWVYEQGATPLVKSFNTERMRQNLQIFDWDLTDEETCKIGKIPQAKGFTGHSFIFPNGQYRSVEELWDGEV
ncbi:methylecgonone reductase [Dorcoceras hygrometricum]|uniref:Methylecgonone reductase n=1 Tax=Dorcoceras hygrometricum TaxID=472368 RepID=A0A2Z7C0L3_9LAMI|nr:methylecgonone reductase [Dorcoceras hygrometricum]